MCFRPVGNRRRPQKWLQSLLFLGVCSLAVLDAKAQTTSNSVTLAWNASSSPEIVNYNVYSGGVSQTYTNVLAVGNVTNATVSHLTSGGTYYFAVTAVDSAGLESQPSSQISYTVPGTNAVSTNALPAPTVVLTAPVNGATYTAPASVPLVASVTANGNAIGQVQFLNGNTVLGTVSASPYSVSWNNVGGGTYSLTAQVQYNGTNSAASLPVSITVRGLTPPWLTLDIGAVGIAGSATIVNGLYTVSGAGNLSGGSDAFRFLYQSLSGNGQIQGQLKSLEPSGTGGCAGAMIRENLTSGSRYAFMGLTPSGGFRWQRRNNTGGGTYSSKSGSTRFPKAWVRVVRSGSTFYGYKSTDGATWTLVNSASIGMATNIYLGWAVVSGSTSSLDTASLTNVSVIP